jgi:uncharacterized protein (TIGR03437 family)
MPKSCFSHFSRRQALLLLGSGAAALAGKASTASGTCVAASPQATEGPYWVDEMLDRSDIRTDVDGSQRPGVPLTLAITVQELSAGGCAPLAGAHVDIWHCDAGGAYSDEAANNTVGHRFLRGYQISDDAGQVSFLTIYPGWYSGRTIHIHVRIRTYSGAAVYDEFTSQLFFDDATNDLVMAQSPYSTRGRRDTRNTNDMVLQGMSNSSSMFVNLSPTTQGYAATATIGVTLKNVAPARPAIAAAGVVNGASYRDGISPGSWAAIFGQNLAASTHTLAAADVAGGNLPTTLAGVSVRIAGQPAFVYYVSPSQIVAQAPAMDATGAVPVVVSNAGGTSEAVNATVGAVAPAFFTSNNRVAAAASGTPGVLALYATGFGPTSPAVSPGTVFNGSAATSNPVAVTVGGVPAAVLYAGLVGAGLYQLNVAMPDGVSGEQEIVAEVTGVKTPAAVVTL